MEQQKYQHEIRLANKVTGPSSLKVNDEEQLKILRNTVLSYWPKSNKKDYFPAPQPVSLERRDLNNMITNDYLVCVKSDGMRFLMVCYLGKTYMVDRAFKFYQVKQNFHAGMGDIGIFDGELVLNNQKRWQYVIHDCVCTGGRDFSHEMFPERYAQVTKLIEDIWIAKDSEFRITGKQFFPFKQLQLLTQLIDENKLDHNTDGLIFTPKNKKFGTGTQYDLYKWKPRKLHTFDFKILKFDNILSIDPNLNDQDFFNKHKRPRGRIAALVNKDGKHILHASTPPGDESENMFIENLTKNCPEFENGNIVECELEEIPDVAGPSIGNIYRPIKIRNDKTHPNSKYTVKKTRSNIKENITVEELIGLTMDDGWD